MPNQPRADNPKRAIRVTDPLWDRFSTVCELNDTTRSKVVQEAIQRYVDEAEAKHGIAR